MELGSTYKDVYTNFQGIAVEIDYNEDAQLEVLGGYPRVLIQPITAGNEIPPRWFGTGRLELQPIVVEQ